MQRLEPGPSGHLGHREGKELGPAVACGRALVAGPLSLSHGSVLSASLAPPSPSPRYCLSCCVWGLSNLPACPCGEPWLRQMRWGGWSSSWPRPRPRRGCLPQAWSESGSWRCLGLAFGSWTAAAEAPFFPWSTESRLGPPSLQGLRMPRTPEPVGGPLHCGGWRPRLLCRHRGHMEPGKG